MKIVGHTEVSSSTFMMQNENGQASMDFLFVLFLQLIQSAMDIIYSSEELNNNGIGSQGEKSNYQRALSLVEESPSLKETFNQAITFLSFLSQFVLNNEVSDQGNLQNSVLSSIKSNKASNTFDKIQVKLNLPTNYSEALDLTFNAEDQSSIQNKDKKFEPMLLSQDTVQNISTFISKAWKEYKALLKETGEGNTINFESVKEKLFVKLNAEWEGLSEQAKAYLKVAVDDSFPNQERIDNFLNINSKNHLNNYTDNQNFTIAKNTEITEESQVNPMKKNDITKHNSHGVEWSKGLENQGERKENKVLTNILEKENELIETSNIFKKLGEKVELESSEREDFFILLTQPEEGPMDLKMQRAERVQLHTTTGPKVALRELPDFVRNIVLEVLPQGEQKARLELFPPDLGRLDIEVRVENGEVSVVGKLENPQAYQDILKEAPVIKTHLEELGLKVKELVFSLTSGDANLPHHRDRQPKENRDGISVKNDSRLLTKGLPKEETLINAQGRYYYIV